MSERGDGGNCGGLRISILGRDRAGRQGEGSILKRVVSVLLVGMIATGAVVELLSASPAGAGNASTGKGYAIARVARAGSKCAAVAKVAPRDSFTARAVSAARAFEASLSSAQRAAVQYSFNSDKRSGWSSVPINLAPRNGVGEGSQCPPAGEAVGSVTHNNERPGLC